VIVMEEKVNIQINKSSKKKLDKIKAHPRETYAQLVERILEGKNVA